MRILFVLLASIVSGCASFTATTPKEPHHPLAAFAVSCDRGDDSRELRAVIIQLDATHAIVGDATETEGVEITPDGMRMGALAPIPLMDLFAMGKEAPLKSGIAIDCGPPTIKTRL